MSEAPRELEDDWPEAMATVLSCTYRPRVGRAVAFGLPASKHFLITYNYWAGEALHEAEMYAAKPIPQGSVFPVRYDPAQPGRRWDGNDAGGAGGSGAERGRGTLLLMVGVAGSVVLSLLWFAVLRGCS